MDPYLSDKNSIICRHCGAEFNSSLPNCPYCGRMNLPAAESEYMAKLETIRGNLEDLSGLAQKKARAHSRVLGRKALIAAAAVIIIAAVILIVRAVRDREDAGKNREEFLWQREAFAQLDELYTAGDWEGLAGTYRSARDEGHSVYQYKHSTFCDYLVEIAWAQATLREYHEEYDSPVYLFSDEIALYDIDYNKNISDEERSVLAELREPLIRDFEQRFRLTDDEFSYFMKMLRKDGFVPFTECERFLKERGL